MGFGGKGRAKLLLSHTAEGGCATTGTSPCVIDDSKAREDWGWQHDYDLDRMSKVMFENLADRYPDAG